MITKAIIEAVVDKYTLKIRVPRLDRTVSSTIKTATQDLNEAIVCTLPKCDPNLQPGDIVFVAIDEQNEDDMIILGHLYREHTRSNACDLILSHLQVDTIAELPIQTTIGSVTSDNIKTLEGSSDNIQLQLNTITSTLSDLNNIVTNLVKQNNHLNDEITKLKTYHMES